MLQQGDTAIHQGRFRAALGFVLRSRSLFALGCREPS